MPIGFWRERWTHNLPLVSPNLPRVITAGVAEVAEWCAEHGVKRVEIVRKEYGGTPTLEVRPVVD